MVFSSHVFLYVFLPVFLAVYYAMLAGKRSITSLNLWITVTSYIFYGWFEPWFVILMWVSSALDYTCGNLIAAPGASPRKRKLALAASMTGNLGLLGFFKYYMFFMGGMNRLIELFGDNPAYFHIYTIVLPIGISFYTFQTMSYTIDVYRGDAPPARNLATFSAFVSLFPQLVAGPIIRYNTVAEQLDERSHTWEKFARGMLLFAVGLGKKILIANPVGELADQAFRADAPGALNAWWGALAYSFQIYFDFSAYSDMACGLGLMIGFEFIRNFNAPYRAQSINNFWKRWHISLTTWFTDYLYVPLGGNRVATQRRLYFNLFVVMFLSGLWHGANLTFVAWGLFHAFFLIWERTRNRLPIYAPLPLPLRILITQVLVLLAWVLFRSPDIGQAWSYWASMFGARDAGSADLLLRAQLFSPFGVLHMGLALLLVLQPIQAFDWSAKLTPGKMVLASAVGLLALATLSAQAFNPFLYFQF
jgi:alginate O-acetyltransferase complex protein AlgI